jgi:catechol 2,3-dioxygenase-like lactoylglutathione lyase family enzyme
MIGVVMRVARPTDNLEAIARMYSAGLGFEQLGAFVNHRGFDGVILGHPRAPYHLEFTRQRGHPVGTAPTRDHRSVFYVPDRDDWEQHCERLVSAGFRQVTSWNPFWDDAGRTFEDGDGYRVVLQNAKWEAGEEPAATQRHRR